VSETGNPTPASFEAELNASDRGLYLSNWSNFPKQNEILNEISYPTVVDKRSTVIFDFNLMPGCKFKEISTSILSGYKFEYEMRNFGNYNFKNFKISIQFRWGAGFLGSKDPRKIINDLVVQCKKRQEELIKQKIAEEKEKERKRIEGEEMRKAEEAAKKQAEVEAATKKKGRGRRCS
jgi:hypothetical protein